MKKIAIQLGLIEASTEAQILTAIKELQTKLSNEEQKSKNLSVLNDNVQSTADEVVKTSKELVKQNDDLENDNKKLKSKIADQEKEVKAQEKQIELLEKSIAELEKANPSPHLSFDELKEKANSILKSQKLERIYLASDGVPFYIENDANLYARKNKLTVEPFGNTEG